MGESGGGGLIDEDDGMGGRLGAGAGGGGIIMPYAFVPPAPVGGAGVGSHPQMHQLSNVGGAGDGVGVAAAAAAAAAGYGNEKRAMRQQYHTPNPSISSGSHYPASSTNLQHFNASGVGSPEPQSPTSDGFSSIGGSAFGGVNYRPLSGNSPGHSVLSSSSGGRNAKEMEAMGMAVVANPDDIPGQLPGFQQAYLQSGPGPHQQQYLSSSSSSTAVPTQHSPTPSRAGTAVVVHADGGRVVLRKGEGEGEPEALNTEIPPTYDSLPVDVRRES